MRLLHVFDWLSWQERHDEPELLDQGMGTLQDVQRNLADMWRINCHTGGLRALTRHLYPRLLQHRGERITIADLGCGAAQLSVHLVEWATRHQITLQAFAVDIAARNLTIARHHTDQENDVHLIQADALRLPFAAQRIDYVVSTLLLHHLPEPALVTLLRQCAALAAKGIIISDLVRGMMPMLGFHAIRPVLARHYLTRHDGMLSIRRAYRSAELRSLAVDAGLVGAQVYEHFPWRMTLVVDR